VSDELNELIREALRTATASLRVLAEEAELHQVTLAKWQSGAAGAGTDSALQLAEALQARALRLLEAATRLEARAKIEKEGRR
jgi:hypothetical protein